MTIKQQLRRAASAVLLSACVFNLTTPGATKPKPSRAKAKTVRVVNVLKPACRKPSYPSPSPSGTLGIDKQCGLAGSGAGAEGQQNSAKNNFCAAGPPKAMTVADLTNLQAQVEKNASINFGSENKGTRKKGPTTNRAPLRKLGEGKLVTLRAFVLIARQEGGESVNCGKNVPDQPLFHDIHISLVSTADATDECSGVVAEMSPHHRPDSWTHENVEKVSRAKLPVRVTGQLYFDSSHFPCSGGQGAGEGNPKRVSLWEIHPIYKFEVCTAGCDGAGTWLPLDQWVKQQ
jgi:hypothetical protein